MKLIRITSDDDNGIFETQFNQSINIKPMSKIGLNNINANLKPISYDSIAQTLTFSYNTTTTTTDTALVAKLLNGIYTRNNYGSMLDQITNGFNGALKYTDATPKTYLLGNQFRATAIDEKVNIEMRVGSNLISWASNELYSYQTTSIYSPSDQIWAIDASIGSTDDYTNGIYSNFNVAKGVGYFRVQINKLVQDGGAGVGLDEQGFIIGLSKTVLSDYTPSDIDVNDISFGIGVGWNGTGWTMYSQRQSLIDDFTVAPTYAGEGDLTNSVLEIRVNGTKIQMLYTLNGTAPIVLEREYDHTSATDLYPFLVFHSNELYARASFPETTLDPYATGISTSAPRSSRALGVQKVFTTPTRLKITQKVLDFSSSGLASFLGYEKTQYKIPENSLSIAFVNFQSDILFYPAINSRNFILELITFNIDSYDSSQRQRRNIISSVISSNENEVITNEPNIIFLDILNSTELDIRNLTLRLVDTEYNPVELTGQSTITLLIANSDERSF